MSARILVIKNIKSHFQIYPMIRDAKLFYLINKDYSPIKEAIEFDPDSLSLSESIIILSFSSNISDGSYIVLSIDPKIDKIIEDNGGIEAQFIDPVRDKIKEQGIHEKLIFFGSEDLVDFLS